MLPKCSEATTRPELTVADVLRAAIPGYAVTERMPHHHWKVMNALMDCRTEAMGGHRFECKICSHTHFVPHSCRNRHCPSCQGINSREWLDRQAASLLPIPYFHLVFTLPHELNLIIQQNQSLLYGLLMNATSATLLEFGRSRFKAQIGVTSVLHTWSQRLTDHYHLHCIVTGGGLAKDGKWKSVKPYWLFPVRALAVVFRAKYRDGLLKLFKDGKLKFCGQLQSLSCSESFERLVKIACRQKWVVYAKRPFAGPEQVLAYLSRYTHRVGISNRRIQNIDHSLKTVTFEFKDYADDAKKKSATIDLGEFVRRFRLHILPPRFVKIRHYGLLSNRNRSERIDRSRRAIDALPIEQREAPNCDSLSGVPAEMGQPERKCPKCGSSEVFAIEVPAKRHMQSAQVKIQDTS